MFQCDCPPDNCEEKVTRYLNGDREAGNELAQKFTRLVHSIVSRALGPDRREEWEDACQIVFLRLFANLDQWKQRCPFCKWLAVVAARRAIDVSRMTRQRTALVLLDDMDPADPHPSASETMVRVEEAVSKLPEEWQAVWRLWREGHSREEMAERLGKSLRTIQYWLAGIMEQLRACLSEE